MSTLLKSSYGTQHNRCLDFSASRQSGSLRVMLATILDQDVRTHFCVFSCTLVGVRPHRRGHKSSSPEGLLLAASSNDFKHHIYMPYIQPLIRCSGVAASLPCQLGVTTSASSISFDTNVKATINHYQYCCTIPSK